MIRKTSLRATTGALALIAAAAMATSACGREGSLERPGPMFGLPRSDPQDAARTPAAADAPVARKRDRDADNGAPPQDRGRVVNGTTPAGSDNTPVTARDLRDPAQRLTPLSAAPIDGLPNPVGPPVSTQPPG